MAYGFDEHGVRRIVNVVRRVENDPRHIGGTLAPNTTGTPQFWRPGYNSSGSTIPAYSVVLIGSSSAINGVEHSNLTQQSTTFSRNLGITVGLDIAASSQCGYVVEAGFVKYGDSSVSPGDVIGPKPSSWVGWKNYPGFRVVQVIDSTNKIALVEPEPILTLHGKADSAISKGSSGTVSIWVGAGGSEMDSTINVTAYARGAAISSGKIVGVHFINGVAYVFPWEC